METPMICWGYIGIMEKEMETTDKHSMCLALVGVGIVVNTGTVVEYTSAL